ncbi:MAG: 4Fe-4S dicluster domain-containing protein [Candidatus Nealsonbacteria bacterium]|nr:4Fe-4S dicluster domain-containing protein [Candidatus Nealsonbacteria bacterium]
MKNITSIIEEKLCTSCGACAVVCPNNAIKMEMDEKNLIYYPKIDASKCNNCGRCLSVCPGKEMFGKNTTANILKSWIVYSKDDDLRRTSQSGGAISQLLAYAIENGIVDGGLVTRTKKDDPFSAETFIARTKEEVLEAARSKYWSIPACLGGKNVAPEDKIIFVGTPCQTTGFKNICDLNKSLKDSVFLYFGLMCGGALNLAFPDMIYDIVGLKQEEREKVSDFDYRFKDSEHHWPGYLRLKYGDKSVILPNRVRIALKKFFYNERCQICVDKLNQKADLVFGDSYIEEKLKNEQKKGLSLVFARTQRGLDFFEKHKASAGLETEEIDAKFVFSSSKLKRKEREAMRYLPIHEKIFSPGLSKRWGVKNRKKPYLVFLLDYIFIDLFKKKTVRKIFSKFSLWRALHKLFSVKNKIFSKIYEDKN